MVYDPSTSFRSDVATVGDVHERTSARASTMTVEDAWAELFAVDAALRTALSEPALADAHELSKNSTLNLAIALISRVDGEESVENTPPWGTPTKTAVERFAEELEVVLRERDRAEMARDRALGQRKDALLAYERQSARVETNEKALNFAQAEIGRLTQKVRALQTSNGGLRGESAERLDRLKRAEKAVIEARAEADEERMRSAKLRKDFEVERQVFKARSAEITRLEGMLRDTKSVESATDAARQSKRIAELEDKILAMAARSVSEPQQTNERELGLLLVQELAKEELKSRARADAAEKLVLELRTQLDGKIAEVISLRQNLESLDRSFSKGRDETPRSFENRSHMSNLDRNLQDSCERAEELCRRLSSVVSASERAVSATMGSGGSIRSQPFGTATPMSGESEGMIRNLQAALEEQAERVANAEKLASRASGEATALREAIANAELIASAAAAVARDRGLTEAYVARGNIDVRSPLSFASTPSNHAQPSFQSPRTVQSSSSQEHSLLVELEEAKNTARKERTKREAAEQAIVRWSRLEE